MTLTITTYDWVPDMARGFVRDLRARWACEEAGLAYAIDTVPVEPKTDAHFAMQPFAQVPILKDGDLSLFESGAIVLHLAKQSPTLMPPGTETQVTEWTFAALNSVEMMVIPWLLAKVFQQDEKAAKTAEPGMNEKLERLAKYLDGREWLLPQGFTAADILMADVLRIPDDNGMLDPYPVLADYVARATARPAFKKAHADQMEHFAKGTPPQGAAA